MGILDLLPAQSIRKEGLERSRKAAFLYWAAAAGGGRGAPGCQTRGSGDEGGHPGGTHRQPHQPRLRVAGDPPGCDCCDNLFVIGHLHCIAIQANLVHLAAGGERRGREWRSGFESYKVCPFAASCQCSNVTLPRFLCVPNIIATYENSFPQRSKYEGLNVEESVTMFELHI